MKMNFDHHPVRVGLIGLNASYPNDIVTGTSWAAAAHLPYLKWSDKYEIVALQNSSIARAEEAIRQYGLPATTKAYEKPEDLAHDPNVDLVVSSIRVDKHAASVIPSIHAGKAVFVEWPLEANVDKVQELADLVKKHKVKNMVGLQGGFAMGARQLNMIIESGVIGKVRSSNIFAQSPWGGPTMPRNVNYFVDKSVGGSIFTITFGHSMEIFTAVVGDINEFSSLLFNNYPKVDIYDPVNGNVVEPGRHNTSYDQIILNAITDKDIVLNVQLQAGEISPKPFRSTGDDPGIPSSRLDWRIFGENGEIRITSSGTWPFIPVIEDLDIKVHVVDETVIDGRQEQDVEHALHPRDELEDLPPVARNIGRLYELFAQPETESHVTYPTFEYALKKHKMLAEMEKRSKIELCGRDGRGMPGSIEKQWQNAVA